jgi:PilZ domain
MLKTVRTNFDRHEQRRDRRYPLPRVMVMINGTELSVLDWSLGGFRTVEAAEVAVGQQVAGSIRFDGFPLAYGFLAQTVRHAEESGTSFRFVDISAELMTALDRAALRRFRGRR